MIRTNKDGEMRLKESEIDDSFDSESETDPDAVGWDSLDLTDDEI